MDFIKLIEAGTNPLRLSIGIYACEHGTEHSSSKIKENALSYSKCACLSNAPHSFPLCMHIQACLWYQASPGEPLIIKLTL